MKTTSATRPAGERPDRAAAGNAIWLPTAAIAWLLTVLCGL